MAYTQLAKYNKNFVEFYVFNDNNIQIGELFFFKGSYVPKCSNQKVKDFFYEKDELGIQVKDLGLIDIAEKIMDLECKENK